jgi:hypothetical protein
MPLAGQRNLQVVKGQFKVKNGDLMSEKAI